MSPIDHFILIAPIFVFPLCLSFFHHISEIIIEIAISCPLCFPVPLFLPVYPHKVLKAQGYDVVLTQEGVQSCWVGEVRWRRTPF